MSPGQIHGPWSSQDANSASVGVNSCNHLHVCTQQNATLTALFQTELLPMPSAYNNSNNNTDFPTCRCLHLIRKHPPPLPTCPYPTPCPSPTYTALRGTWPVSPARWCCWLCTRTLQHLCIGFLWESGTKPARGCAPRCAHPGSGRKGIESQGLGFGQRCSSGTNTNLPHSSPPVLSTWKRSPGRWNHGHSTS